MQKYIQESRRILLLAIPVIIAQGSQTAMGVVDTIMAGAVSSTDMAAVAVGTSIWLPVILFCHGILLVLTPTIAQLNGSAQRDKICNQSRQGYWLATFLSVFAMVIFYNSPLFIGLMSNVDPELARKANGYLFAMMFGVPGYLFFQVLRNQCEGLSRTKPGMVIGIIGLIVNIPVNYIFIHGLFGMPQLGGIGCGVATATVYWVSYLAMRYYVATSPVMKDIKLPQAFTAPNKLIITRLFKLGLPVGLAYFFEISLFAIVALLLTPLGVTQVAGHQIALSFSSVMFVLPISFSVAATIRIGHSLGESSTDAARVATRSALMVAVMVACCTAIFSALFREQIANLYNNDLEVVTLASHLMLFAAIYQITDSIQIVGNGVLRGYKDTRSIFYITFVAYWVLGLPSGYILGLTDWVTPAMGAQGFWIGFIIGITFSAIVMLWRILWLHRQSDSITLERSTR